MKQTLLAVLFLMTVTSVALAQAPTPAATAPRRKMTIQTTPAAAYGYSYATNEVTALLGFNSAAPVFGANYARMNGAVGFGGYFFMQTAKDKATTTIISQVLSFGGLIKVNLVDTASVKAYMAPGVGLSMIKEGSISATGKADETVIGPVWKMGVLYKLSQSLNIGLETTLFGNFFNDNLTNYKAPSQYFAVAATFAF